MKKIKKIIKITLITLICLFSLCIISGVSYYHAVTNSVTLDTAKLESNKQKSNLKILDKNKNIIKPVSNSYAKISELSTHTKNAFISAEDKRFYNHNGIDYIRIGGAIISNLKTKSFSEGASTISQQLVKNTHLSSEKTISRKLKEIKLTSKLENLYSKDEILELYLNSIYFGNGTYGIETASNHYFSKPAKHLTLAESALLAATINAPTIYNIENNTEKTIQRRNLILDQMAKQNKITSEQADEAKSEPAGLKITKNQASNYIYDEVVNEACKILKLSKDELTDKNITIQTYIDQDLQNELSNQIKKKYSNTNANIATLVINNKTNGIVAVFGNKSVLSTPKQPGSAIKPILVYAPAIEYGIISPATKLLDDEINISGYKPENADKKFHGMVSAREALKNSYNIPAVKLLNEIGITKAQNFAKNLGINFSENDNNLSIALGGFTNGITLKSLADAYSAFANEGNFSASTFIKSISKNGKVIYENNKRKNEVMSKSTAYLITNMLVDTAKSGTAKRLKNLDYEVASKTGTVGKSHSTKNTDAYNVSYTSTHTILSYFGGDTLSENINGSTYPTMLTKDVLERLYKTEKPKKFKIPTSVSKQKIDKNFYNNTNKISLTDDIHNSLEDYFKKTY